MKLTATQTKMKAELCLHTTWFICGIYGSVSTWYSCERVLEIAFGAVSGLNKSTLRVSILLLVGVFFTLLFLLSLVLYWKKCKIFRVWLI